MREYENNSSTNNENSENDTALSIETLIINLHTWKLSPDSFGCGNEGRTPIMKTSRNKVAIYLQRNSLLIQDKIKTQLFGV